MTQRTQAVEDAIRSFCDEIKMKFAANFSTWPEDQLKSPLDNLLTRLGRDRYHKVVVVNTEAPQPQGDNSKSGGRVDAAVRADDILTGHVELKKPGDGADPAKLKGEHNRKQWEKFKRLPNLIYTDGRQWGLYRSGVRVGRLIKLSGDPVVDGAAAVAPNDAAALEGLLEQFLSWSPIVPTTSKGIAELLAPLCLMLRREVRTALDDQDSYLRQLAGEWRSQLFPNSNDDEISDAYAQTFTYALLIARFEGAQLISRDSRGGETPVIENAENTLAVEHSLLSEVLRLLTAPRAFDEVKTSATTLLRVVGAVDPARIVKKSANNPWLYFYEDFLAEYDPALRKKVGAYYTPVEVVSAQVHLVRSLLTTNLGATEGFADTNVVTLDPATGTGTYPLEILQSVVDGVPANRRGSIPALLGLATKNLYGFEYLIGPYAVAHLRLSRFLVEQKVTTPAHELLNVLLANTLDSHEAEQQPILASTYEAISHERERARQVKASTKVVVCIGNPPYRRGTAKDIETGESTGGWVVRRTRAGTAKVRDTATRRMVKDRGEVGIIDDFFKPARQAGHGGDLKNAYNAYVYFWRWALWKVFEQPPPPSAQADAAAVDDTDQPACSAGVVSFITASSYLRGPAFVGMRQHMRAVLDEVWIIDLGGDNKGARKSANVFSIETPVAIAVGVRYGEPHPDTPATVRYAELINKTEAEKKSVLAGITSFNHPNLDWQECLSGWQDPFLPAASAEYLKHPLLTDLFPWQAGGAQVKRTWPIGETLDVLRARWKALVAPLEPQSQTGTPDLLHDRRARQFKETRDRKVDKAYPHLMGEPRQKAIAQLVASAPCPSIERYAYRSLDRQWIIADNRLGDYMRPSLWRTHGSNQVYLCSFLTEVIGAGPAAIAAANVPDLHHFRGSFGGRHVLPLWKDAAATMPNVTIGLLDSLSVMLRTDVTAPDLFAYCYGLMATPAYAREYWDELTIPGPRIPITTSADLFRRVAHLGRSLIHLHTYGERMAADGAASIPDGTAEYAVPIPATIYPNERSYDPDSHQLHIGDGRYDNIAPEVWEYSISGLNIVDSWLGNRMLKRAGKNGGSPLDSIRPKSWPDPDGLELLNLLWIIEHTIKFHPEGAALLDEVTAGETLHASDVPQPSDEDRNPFGHSEEGEDVGDSDDEGDA